MARSNPSNPFKLDDHYDESFLLEDDDDDEDSPLEDLPHERGQYNQPHLNGHLNGYDDEPEDHHSAAHRVPSASSRSNRPSSARHGARSARVQSGRFRQPQPPGGPAKPRASDRVGRIGGGYDDSENDDSSELESTDDEFQVEHTKGNTRPKGPEPPKGTQRYPSENSESEESEAPGGQNSHASDEGSTEDDTESDSSEPGYRPSDYQNLPVNKEIKDIFSIILRYKPKKIPLVQKLKPFIPEFVPAVGDIDAFLKIPRPDNQDEKYGLGWRVLDEPSLKQTDPAVLDQTLKTLGRANQDGGGGSQSQINFVHSVENAEKDSKRIESWIEEITNLNRSKPSQTVTFTKPMPDVDSIMAAWPEQVDEKIRTRPPESLVPSAEELDCGLEEYARMLCTLFDVPVYDDSESTTQTASSSASNNNLIQSLHVLFSTYSQFKQLDFAQSGEGAMASSSTNLLGDQGQQQATRSTRAPPGRASGAPQQSGDTQFSNVMTF